MPELAPAPTTVEPVPPRAPSAADSTPIPVLAEGTAPVAVAYRPAPRRAWPFVVAGLVLAAIGVAGHVIHAKREARRELEARYPIAATAGEQAQLEAGADRWSNGRLLAAIASFEAPDLATLKGVGACTLQTANVSRHTIQRGDTMRDLAASARLEIEQLVEAARRERFASVDDKQQTLRALAGAFLVVRVDEMREPELDRAHDSIAPGIFAGTAYAFDPASGDVRCAGTFRVTSGSEIRSLSSFSGLDRAREAAIRDFEAQVEAHVVSSLRSID